MISLLLHDATRSRCRPISHQPGVYREHRHIAADFRFAKSADIALIRVGQPPMIIARVE